MGRPIGRVLHYVPWSGLGGTEKAALNICKATRQLDPAVWFPSDGPVIREFERAGIAVMVGEDPRGDFALLHIHDVRHRPEAHDMASRLGLRSLVTLHGRCRLPELDCPVVCVSLEVAAMQMRSNHVLAISNGVDTAEFTPAVRHPSDRVVIIRVCRPERSADYFFESMRRVLDRHPAAELWIVGESGPSGSRIRFLGPRPDAASLLPQADIFAYAPRPDEGGHDLCVLEAMSAGVPPVVTDVGAVRQSVSNLHDGLLVSFGDATAFAEAVESLIVDRGLRESLSRNARQTAIERFGLEALGAAYLPAYEAALEELPPDLRMRRKARSVVEHRQQLSKFESNLVLLHDTLAATPLAERYWVIGGLLLGWAREGRILPHDCHDADFGLFREHRELFPQTALCLIGAGFRPLYRYLDNNGEPVEYSFQKDEARFDFFVHERADGRIRCTFFGNAPRPDRQPIQLVSQFREFEFGAMEFLGRTWRKPADHEAFLAAEYGEWRIPNPAFDHRRDDLSVIEIEWWEKASQRAFAL